MQQILQGSNAHDLVFFMYDSSDHVTGKTGLSPTVTIRKEGGSFTTPGGGIQEIGNGFYEVQANASDTNTLGVLILSAVTTGADQATMAYQIVAFNPDDVNALGLLNLDAQVSTRLADSSYTAPANSDIAAIKAKTDQLAFTSPNLVDANTLLGGGGSSPFAG